MSSLFLDCSIPDLIRGLREGTISFRDMAETTLSVVAEREDETLAWVCFDPQQLVSESERAARD